MKTDLPISVVIFGGGPVLEPDVEQFLNALEDHPEIDIQAIICQTSGGSFSNIAGDMWRRRGWLAIPLLLWHQLQSLLAWNQRRRLRDRSAKLQSKIYSVQNIHDDAVLQQVKRLEPTLGLVYGSPVLKPTLFNIPKAGTLGIHHGKVPQYRGKKTPFWAMYNGEEHAGITIQRINAGIDTGEIVREGTVKIGRKSYHAVWSELSELGIHLYLQAILDVKRGQATYLPQSGPKGPLYRDPKPSDLLRFYWRQFKRKIS